MNPVSPGNRVIRLTGCVYWWPNCARAMCMLTPSGGIRLSGWAFEDYLISGVSELQEDYWDATMRG